MRRPGFSLLIPTSFLSLFLAGVVRPAAAETAVDSGIEERVVVTSTRLDDKTTPVSDVPASVTILDREQIEASGARNLQDLLVSQAGISIVDQVGNDVQKTLDLRGFTRGRGVAVFVDGARVNDPRNNTVALEQVPLNAVERIEVTRGPAAALAGGGAEAGVIRIITRRGTVPGASLTASAGTWDTQRYDGSYGADFGRFDLFVGGTYDTSEGFKPNAGGRQTRIDAAAGLDLGAERRLSLSVLSSDLAYGNPGALTLSEFEADPRQNVFNQLDNTDDELRQASLNFQGAVGSGWSVAANAAYRTDHAETLTTGRSAPIFGGFFLDSDGSTWTGAAQATWDVASSGGGGNRLAIGVEYLDGDTDSTGFFTSPTSPGDFDPSAPASLNTAGTRNGAVFVQDTWSIGARWSVSAGARGDSSRVHYVETIPGTTPSDSKTFSEISFRAGATFRPTDQIDLYLSYGDGFLPPTAEELFAFPLFGSNADLRPEDTRAYELGARKRGGIGSIEAALFWTETNDEIVFDPTPTVDDPFGQNVNADATRRRGVEVSATGRLARGVSAFGNVTFTDAEFTAGVNEGKQPPLIPKYRLGAGLDAAIPGGAGVRTEVVYVGAQVLDNDAANTRTKLGAYAVVNLRVHWERSVGGDPAHRRGRLGLFVESRNLLDEQYATRGIFAFDFSTGTSADFVTPAPGRRYLAGLTWRL
jgi:iron complex outermembrane receptor protein